MKIITHYTPVDLPGPLKQRMAQIRAARGTAAAHAFADVVLSHMRRDANVAYLRRVSGAPIALALKSFAFDIAVVVPVLYVLSSSTPLATFLILLPIAGIYILARALSAYLNGGT